ncbi:MAG: hypothetical protein NTY07_19985 [Bacteroidia bacterium]|nr:hypothetical protein [Bacteroidia bacterium]
MEQTNNKMNLKSLAGITVGVIVMVLVQHFFFKAPSFDKQMMQAASELNKTCPMMVDKETQLDNSVALPEKTFQYNYTLVNMVKDSIDIQSFKNYIEPIVTNNMKTNPDMKFYRDNKITMSYYYKDKNGVFVIKIAVTPDKYQ